ncbi:MAG TPA: pitrilysin family protein [Kofleriaceae bacterium]|jgi:zinc protease
MQRLPYRSSIFRRLATAAAAASIAATGWAAELPPVDIPYASFQLSNGLTVLVHEDHKAPIVAVNVWYHVGSKNEPNGRSGFAHLFEHLMFNGSENFNDDYFKVVERLGATDLNGTTNEDRTNYFQNVPVAALDTVLWLESDRMGHLLGVVDQPRLDEQRGVVQNEKRQGDNEPYAISEDLITRVSWPEGHPYDHTVIGSMEDLSAAKLEDVKDWFGKYYGPSNAVITLAGDIDQATAKAKVEKYFGDLPPGPPVPHPKTWVAKRTGTVRESAEDRVPQSRLYRTWNVPPIGDPDWVYLTMVANVLTGDKGSRLYKRLIYQDQIATQANAFLDEREIASLFTVLVTAQPGGDLGKVEAATAEEISKLINEGPTADEVERVRNLLYSRFVRGAERIGGFGGKSDVLLRGAVYEGNPAAYKNYLDRLRKATPADLQRAAKAWLADGDYVLSIVPFPQYAAAAAGADRKAMPEVGAMKAPVFPTFERAKLSNGLEVVLAERHEIPKVELGIYLDGGYAADSLAAPGTARLAMDMLDEGTQTRDALAISEALSRLGATLNSGANLDQNVVTMSALSANLDDSLALFADVLLNPAFKDQDLSRLKKLQIAAIQREKASPVNLGLRVAPPLLYGAGHAYAVPFSGSGTPESVEKLQRTDLAKFHSAWFKPNHAYLIVVGDTNMATVKPKLEKLLGSWKSGDVPKKNLATVAARDKSVVYLVDKPGAQQSVILASSVVTPQSDPRSIAFEAFNDAFGGSFVSRLNMNLREDKHWSYGAGAFLLQAAGQRPYIGFAPVQTDKTKESVAEVAREMREVISSRPLTDDELAKAKTSLTQSLPGGWETANAVAASQGEILRFGYPADYWQKYPERIRALTAKEMAESAKALVHPEGLVWVIVGDRAKVEAGLRELNLGEFHVLDADGKEI